GRADALAYALAPAHLWDGLWPILIGGAVAGLAPPLGARGLAPRVRVPEGDLVALAAPVGRAAAVLGARLAATGARVRDRWRAITRRVTADTTAERWSAVDAQLRRPATAGLGLLLAAGLLISLLLP
ncbi:MAG TPA: hypothetical protein VFG47_09375, partial [Geminicoccaceae bacterium]|nr:hypothetical protein [Geminicoccaceae bacterium]